jgi:hypothetical protein
MKTILKSLFVAAVFVSIGTTAHAQLGAQTSVAVGARILKKITFNVADTLNFGTVAAGEGITFLNPQVQAASQNVGFNSRVGRLIINATGNEVLRVNYDSIVVMTRIAGGGGAGSDSILYRPFISAIHGQKENTIVDRANSLLVSDQTMTRTGTPVARFPVTAAGGFGIGGVALISTDESLPAPEDDDVTLFLGGQLLTVGKTEITTTTGRFRGTINFNVVYFD